jgi:hypothetical protein
VKPNSDQSGGAQIKKEVQYKEMNRFARMLLVGLGIIGAGTALSLVPHKAANAGGMTDVTVTNVPLPVTQSGAWNVGINGTPSVNATIANQVPVTGTVNANVTFPANQSVTLNQQSILELGKLPSQQVVLTAGVQSNTCAAWMDANTGQCFSGIPTGAVLVIKDINWIAQTTITNPGISGNKCELNFWGAANAPFIFSSYATSDVNGGIDKNEHLAGGLYINPAVLGSQAPVWSLSNAYCSNPIVTLQGYLVPNQ